MLTKKRIFPRYTTSQLKIEISFPMMAQAKFYLENASLSGLQIYGKSKMITTDFNEITIKLSEKESFIAHAFQVWDEEDASLESIKNKTIKKHFHTPAFRCGLRLKFIEQQHYEKWLKFITALHLLGQKSLKKK